jgi:hypothetical protein
MSVKPIHHMPSAPHSLRMRVSVFAHLILISKGKRTEFMTS